MPSKKWLYILATICFVPLDCEVYEDRPKIKTTDGNLYLTPAFNKNVYLTPNGPNSGIFVGDVNLLKTKTGQNGDVQPWTTNNNDLDELINGPNGILQRIQSLESKDTGASSDLLVNVTALARKVDNLNRKVRFLQVQLINRVNKDECESNPCQHGGTCLNLANGYYCLCPSNWEGKDCDTDVNECRNFAGTDLGCQNGATCINRPGSYECFCRPGWFGLHCTRKEKDCSGGDFEMCGYGTCVQVSSGVGIKCICKQGWTTNSTGIECLTDVNECETSHSCSVNPRVECINLPGSFRCGACPSGYEGDGFRCSDVDECTTIPNGGCSNLVTCHNTIGSRICGPCPPGYQGDGMTCTWRGACNINHGGCHPSAQCIQQRGNQAPQCVCPAGMIGNGIGISGCYVSSMGNLTLDCDSNPCGNNGQCHNLRNGYTCICYKGYGGAHCDAPLDYCATNPCLNGGICRADLSTARGYRCECTAQFSGPLCQLRFKSCGGLLDAEEGSILYPLSNNTMYNHNAQCAWVIRTVPEKVVNVTFTKFDLEESPECTYDFLQIHDGAKSASQLIGRYCGKNFPRGGNILSSHNNLYLWFHSDKTVAKEGFALHWSSVSPVCGGDVDATKHGSISSPGSPGPYPPNRDCYWHLTTTLGKRINLHFFALDIEAHTNCSFDYLAIYDGEHDTDPLISKYCSSIQPAPIQSQSSDLLIHFHSDAYGSGTGFQIAYAPVEGVPGCGGYYTTNVGEITSPSYGSHYLNNLICEYRIKTGADTRIKIEFKSFKIESSGGCRYDYLKIYDGSSEDSPFVGRFCGNTYPKTYTSTSNNLYLKFVTDRSLAAEGFRITYESICQKTFLGDSGVITSPGYPFKYPHNKVCEYIIRANPGKAIQLTFQTFDLEDNSYYNCRFDNVEVRDGFDSNATLLGKYCAGRIPPAQTSTHNFMYIKFSSDMSISGAGFYANYTTIDTECGGIYRETTGLINFPSNEHALYNNEQKCSWLLIAPEGMHIKLSWNRFDIEDMPQCRSDFLQLIGIDDDNTQNDLGKFCGNVAPPAITTSTNRILLKFESDISVRSPGFSLSYTFLDDKSHCDRMYIRKQGYIYSPGWPKTYEPNRDCTWIISVPVGQQILLNVSQFNLERPIRNKCDLGDYLEIRNGDNANSPLIGQYCGSFESRLFKSLTNVLYLHFHSDFYLTGTGFKIEWDGTLMGCGGTLTSFRGSITSPNYPNNYHDNSECFYKIVTNPGSRISLSFADIDLEQTVHCSDDYVEIYDGRDFNAPSLGRFCSMTSSSSHIETSANYVLIKFRSDLYRSSKGFLLNYETVCNTNLTGRYGVIESPGYPDSYPLGINCLWNIKVLTGNRINVTFTSFDIYKPRRSYHPWVPTRTCDNDYIQIKESTSSDFLDKICGNTLPTPIHTTSNSLQIKFETGSFTPKPGFRLEWVRDGCGEHIQKPSGSIYLDKSLTSAGSLECDWLIETQMGTSITMTFTSVFMEYSNNCTSDAIEIYNGQDVSAPILSKICHQDMVTIQSDNNIMFIKFTKQSSLKDVHFRASYRSFQAKCGGFIRSKTGIIQSPNYPQNYGDNLNCIWYISVPKGHRIEFNIIDLDLYSIYGEYDVNDNCGDSIKIFEGMSSSANYSNQICPYSNISQIIVNNHSMKVEFQTDRHGTAKGFKANFTITCGAIINADEDGEIRNHQFISNTNSSCVWTIVAPTPDQKISLTLRHISIPINNDIVTNRKCPSSFLRVYDGNDVNAPLIDEYCGRKAPPMIVSHGSALTLELGSYTDRVMGLFVAQYSPLNNTCGGRLTAEMGSIASPNYPGPYPENMDCEWTIFTSAGGKAYVTIERLDLESSYKCNEDYLEIRENNDAGGLLGVYCGNEIPVNNTVASKVYIKFHSNSQSSGQGFLLHYGYIHNSVINGDSGEISSPLYPLPYHGSGVFTWKITTGDYETITLNIKKYLLPSFGDSSGNTLSIYDGLDDTDPLLEEFKGALSAPEPSKTVQSSTNSVLIKLTMDESNSGSSFQLKWSKLSRVEDLSENEGINCGSNQTQLVLAGASISVNSPNYPKEYNDNLICEWIYKAQPGRHLQIKFIDFKLEETNGCFADSVSIYTSESAVNWKPIKENICLSSVASEGANSTNFLKLKFKTDSSITRTGFKARIYSKCGGFIYDRSSEITITRLDIVDPNTMVPMCDWIVKVRPGRTIRIEFTHFNITNAEDSCSTSVTLRNGDSVEAPLLAGGRYCGHPNENRTGIETSSNALFVRFTKTSNRYSTRFENFVLRYEESNVECGLTSQLSLDHSWETINSPNYPKPPVPFTECEWVFIGPPGEVLRIDFTDRFDLNSKDINCESEYIEIRDGSSVLSPLKGHFCKKQGTIKSTNNVLYIKYATHLDAPNNGFKANISIETCGGTIIANNGQLSSPGYPHLGLLQSNTVCEWQIIGSRGYAFKIQPVDINLPDSANACGTKITIEETISPNNTKVIIRTFCSDDFSPLTVIESSTNQVSIKLHLGPKTEWSQISINRGFRFTFNSSIPQCGGTLRIPEGYLTSPSYPQYTSLMYCHWTIQVPNKNRRVQLELLDFDLQRQKIGIYNDDQFLNLLQRMSADQPPPTNRTFESSGNKMSLFVWLNRAEGTTHRFKAKYNSNEDALCGGDLNGLVGDLVSPNINRSYSCEWHYFNEMADSESSVYFTINVKTSASLKSAARCKFFEPKLALKADLGNGRSMFNRNICSNTTISYRVPSTNVFFTSTKDNSADFNFDLTWKVHPCGGNVHVGEEPKNILKIPATFNDTLECAWTLQVPGGNRVQVKLEGIFQLECEDQYITITSSLDQYDPVIDKICKNKGLSNPLMAHFRHMYIQYHSKPINNTNITLSVNTVTNQCGGTLSNYRNMFKSPGYSKSYQSNLNCVWEIQADLGYRISLSFINRFSIEETPNCTKDAIIIYDWKDDDYIEVARICGRQAPPAYNSTYNRMKVIFRTDNETNMEGFKATWLQICGGNYTATEEEHIIYSPGFPFHYPSSIDCKYEISAPNNKVYIKFLEFELEGTYPDCDSDNLTISAQSDYEYVYNTYCGTEIPPTTTSFENVSLIFKTDRYFRRKGFKIAYNIYLCGGKVNDSTIISSTENGIETYSANLNCTWFIEAPKSKIVVLKFQYIDLENINECGNDYIAVYEGDKINYHQRLALMCGHINSTTVIRSTGNSLVLAFVTDSSLNFKGFKAEVFFSYSQSVGCGGQLNVTSASSYTLKSPLIGNNFVYENYLDCHWKISSPPNTKIRVTFSSFHISPCLNINQTAIGYSKCDCDVVQVTDGINPNSLLIGTYCGHSLPPQSLSSDNTMGIRFYSDGELVSSGFEARLTVERSVCDLAPITISKSPQRIKSPDYDKGVIPRSLHCAYRLDASADIYSMVRITIVKLDLAESETVGANTKQCTRDKLVISTLQVDRNRTFGEDFVVNQYSEDFFANSFLFYDNVVQMPSAIELCGHMESTDYYVYGSVAVNLITSAETDSHNYKGFEMEVQYMDLCGRNYTEPYGRIQASYGETSDKEVDCYTLITAPENRTISVYFLSSSPAYWDENCYLEIFDGNQTSSRKIIKILRDYENFPVFSTGRYLLLHNHQTTENRFTFDLNYITTDKGPGCGGKLANVVGRVTSPKYPNTYRREARCEWDLETPIGTRVLVHFESFDVGPECDKNYLQLVDSKGVVFSTYCFDSTPADYRSDNNFVKIVYVTSRNNNGRGWLANFVGFV